MFYFSCALRGIHLKASWPLACLHIPPRHQTKSLLSSLSCKIHHILSHINWRLNSGCEGICLRLNWDKLALQSVCSGAVLVEEEKLQLKDNNNNERWHQTVELTDSLGCTATRLLCSPCICLVLLRSPTDHHLLLHNIKHLIARCYFFHEIYKTNYLWQRYQARPCLVDYLDPA